MKVTLYTAGVVGNQANCIYPNHVIIQNKEQMKAAVKFDHVCALYEENYRGNDRFMHSDDVVLDCDNDHSDNPNDWVTPEMFAAMEPDIDFIATPSRHHMIEKDGKEARPKWHAHFPVEVIYDKEQYVQLKKAIHEKYPFFDGHALDAARFFFGSEVSEVFWQEGWLSIADVISTSTDGQPTDSVSHATHILSGSRNSTMSHFAGRILTRYGLTDKAKEAFLDHAKKCVPPLDSKELAAIWQSATKFYQKKVVTSNNYVPPEQFNADFDKSSLKPDDYSDIGEAKVLVREYGSELKYTKATDYLRHDGLRWVEDKELAVGAVEEFLDLQLEDAKDDVEVATQALKNAGVSNETIQNGSSKLLKELTEKQTALYYMLVAAQTYLKFVMKYRNYKNIINTQNAAKPMLAIDVNDLDKNPFLLNTPIGTIDMKKGMSGIHPHTPEDLITKITAVAPSQEGKDIWLEALETFFCGDQELINYVQMMVGLTAIGKVYQEHMIIAYGGGANGKSTFWNTIYRVLGNYAGKISAEALTMNNRRNVKPEMAELKGKRLIIASEMEEGVRLNTATVKQLCSTDEIQAEKKYKDPFSFVPSHTLVLYTNHLPKVGANDDGIWRRLIVIPFNAKITGKSDIKNYADYLFENAGGAVLEWIVEGAYQAIQAQFKTKLPKVVEDAIEKYHEDNDWLGQFLDECCELSQNNTEQSGKLYLSYRTYCIQNGEFTRSTTDFYAALEKAGYFKKRSKNGVVVFGLSLKEENIHQI